VRQWPLALLAGRRHRPLLCPVGRRRGSYLCLVGRAARQLPLPGGDGGAAASSPWRGDDAAATSARWGDDGRCLVCELHHVRATSAEPQSRRHSHWAAGIGAGIGTRTRARRSLSDRRRGRGRQTGPAGGGGGESLALESIDKPARSNGSAARSPDRVRQLDVVGDDERCGASTRKRGSTRWAMNSSASSARNSEPPHRGDMSGHETVLRRAVEDDGDGRRPAARMARSRPIRAAGGSGCGDRRIACSTLVPSTTRRPIPSSTRRSSGTRRPH